MTKNLLRQFGDELLHIFGLRNGKPMLATNFRDFGPSFGVYDYEDFVIMARQFFQEGISAKDSFYTVIDLPDNRVGIDYNGEKRGIYKKNGEPIAFFRPDFQRRGFTSKSEELAAWRRTSEAA